jgi:hypothetical protein
MPSNSDMDRLANLAVRARERPEWMGFAQYCELRGQGIRAGALNAVGQFLRQTGTWTFGARLQFTRWVLDESVAFLDPSALLPQTIQAGLVVPTLREWSASNPQEPQSYLWLGLLRCDDPLRHLERALELDSTCEAARQMLTQWILADVDYNQHELPASYIHDPRVDLRDLIRAEQLVDDSATGAWAKATRVEIAELRGRAEVWLAAHPREGDFAVH